MARTRALMSTDAEAFNPIWLDPADRVFDLCRPAELSQDRHPARQLEDARNLKVCWLVMGDRDPVREESALIDVFKKNHQEQRPFANRIDGKNNHP